MTEDWESLASAADLLSRLWIREVDEELVRQLNAEPLQEAFTGAGGVVPNADGVEDLAVEYCRLFVGPRDHLPPHQSVWQRGDFQSDAAVSVARFADACGLAHDDFDSAMTDHLGAELAVLARMLHCRAFCAQDYRENAPSELATDTDEMLAEFYRRHLHWCLPLLDAVEEKTTAAFYRQLAVMTRDFLALLRG